MSSASQLPELKYQLNSRDTTESARLSAQHCAYTLTIGGKLHPYDFEAGLKDGARVLDIGTGNGIWALELAARHPGVQIIGTDIVEVTPATTPVPPNVKFVVHNVLTLADTPFVDPEPFDVVHVRFMQSAIKSMTHLLTLLHPLLRVGGTLLLCEASLAAFASSGGPLIRMFVDISEKRGLDPYCGENLARDLAAADGAWTDIQQFDITIPIGERAFDEGTHAAGREMKNATLSLFDEVLEVARKHPQPGMSPEQTEGMFAGMKNELETHRVEWESTYVAAKKA